MNQPHQQWCVRLAAVALTAASLAGCASSNDDGGTLDVTGEQVERSELRGIVDALCTARGLQDTMGFTVAGPDRFLGSGHPDVEGVRQGQPGPLGLIGSTDAGKSWSAISLSGEVDFHGLAFAHGRTYGWDSASGRFMVASDQRSWETRSTRRLIGFAVDPADADHVVAAGPEGLLDSDDGGRTWQRLRGPALMVLSWDKAPGLVGADADGAVHRSTDGGASWSRVGRLPGSPQAFLATADALYAAADADGRTGIYRSTDDGRTWRLRYRDDTEPLARSAARRCGALGLAGRAPPAVYLTSACPGGV